MYSWLGHDDKWPNNARNALKGSCNIYFSKLARRLDPIELQEWLFKFGYGRKILLGPSEILGADYDRGFRQVRGLISSRIPDNRNKYLNFTDLPEIKKTDLKWFGIGQGSLYASPLQVANAMAVIARGGFYIRPKLFVEQNSFDQSISLGISDRTIKVVKEGMFAVVNENEGTAHNTFAEALDYYKQNGVKVFGKTGSTERPNNAWFAGFAEDRRGVSLAFSLIVEGGESGSKDAAPLARDMVKILIDDGYLGNNN
jgi:penicillin-binding protein 2